MTDSTNPLAGYFRGADVHQELPTRGAFFEPGEIDLAINGEVAVLPMTASDEIILKNPDALLNGDALERLFSSCVPAIKVPRKISVPDMDVLLLAIKLASYGDDLDIQVICPKCQKDFTVTTSIRHILSEIKMLEEQDTVVRVNDNMVVYLRPYDFTAKTKLDLSAFEESKLLQHLLSTDAPDEEKSKLFNKSYEKVAELNLDLLSHCIRYVEIPDPLNKERTIRVDNEDHIRDFVRNSDKRNIKKIQEQLKLVSQSGINRNIEVTCPNSKCKHGWSTEMTFDPSHFFA
jgi:hypothetical protein